MFMFVITMYFEGSKEDWYCQLGHPRKIKNLLTYLQKCIVITDVVMTLLVRAESVNTCVVITLFMT